MAELEREQEDLEVGKITKCISKLSSLVPSPPGHSSFS